MKNPFSKKNPSQQEAFLRTYLDRIAPGVVKFEVDHYIFGSTYRCVWALREYPASTEAQALLRALMLESGRTEMLVGLMMKNTRLPIRVAMQ